MNDIDCLCGDEQNPGYDNPPLKQTHLRPMYFNKTDVAASATAQAITLESDQEGRINRLAVFVYTQAGTGASPAGKIAVVHYTGWLYNNGIKGQKFDSSVDRGKPFEFPVGQGRVIKGWEQGVSGMQVGGKRELVIPLTGVH